MCINLIKASIRYFLLFIWLCSSASMVHAQVGQVRLVIGPVQLESSISGSKQLELNDQIYQGDQITTPATGYAVVTLVDETKFTIKPSSVFKFNNVINQPNGNVFTELLKGGLKVITGKIGSQNPPGFKVDTPLGSIGIRGTNFDAILCELNGVNCVKLYESLGCPQEPPDQTEELLYVTVSEGVAYLDDCQDDPDILPGQVGVTDGTSSNCKILNEVPCFMQEFNWEREQVKDQHLKSLEVPVLQNFDINSFCQGDPICIQCEGDPGCIQCDGDPDCMQCQGDPICIQCLGDPLCVQCQGDPICIQCLADPLCVQCQGDPLCIQCNADPQCIQCNASQICILCMGDPICEVCQGDQACIDRLNNPMEPDPMEPDPMEPDPMEPDPMIPPDPTCNPQDIECICMMNPEDPVCPMQCPPGDIVCECDGNIDCICDREPNNPMCPTKCDVTDTACICMIDPFDPVCPPVMCDPDDTTCQSCQGDIECICQIEPSNPLCP